MAVAESAQVAELAVEVAYALPEQQTLLALTVPAGSTVEQVIQRSGILRRYPEIDLAATAVGIWSRPVALSLPVQAGDRIEIYRPLIIDPQTTLRQREKAKRRR
ncbi:RnfH family protein [Permianibacter sp. IMCC34836]|uniref:RnfH family protein n=1 Tax=Permianibacter fluminis TaxID=2738515 RepID=UPI0015537AD5|nr:RnfH family protein [Permianibacter fluminis]NQD36841.1 RnfH family protein [Permianibacter fluminis]